MLDLLIKGGTVVDGSGAKRFVADVGISGGRIASVGRVSDPARRVIDADGLIVAPGFIDGHTHMDAQVMWDPLGTCSCYHGVTTVVMSNCGFTLAPCKPADREWYASCLSYVEDIPAAAMAAGIDWTWETFPEYLAAVERRPKALNHAMYVGHSALRMYVMGRRALTDEATDDEIRAITRLIQEALRAGAVGVSTSRTHTHMTPEGSPVASRQAAWKEVEAIFAAMAELGTGIFQIGQELLSHTANVAFLERMKHFVAQFDLFRIHVAAGAAVAIEETDLRVEIPTVVVEWIIFGECRIDCFDLVEVLLFQVQETDYNISDLDACVVDVVLHLDSIARGFQDSHERVAQDGIAHVTNVGSFVGVNARVFDHLLRSIKLLFVLGDCPRKDAEQFRAIVKDIDVTGARDLDARDFFDVFELSLELFRDAAGVLLFACGLFDQFCQFE